MDDRYRDYFRQRVNEFQFPEDYRLVPSQRFELYPAADEAARAATEAARSAASDRGLHLREDAEFLILLLARELVGRPVATVVPEESRGLEEDLVADSTLVVARAVEESDDKEVSAHNVIDALSGVWDDLRSGRYNLWDRRRRR